MTTNLYQAGFDASWELDLFGGTRREIEAADAEVAAAEEGQRGVMVSLLAEAATDYADLRLGQQQLDLARRNLAAQEDSRKIVEAKFRRGLATDSDVTQQAGEVETTAGFPADPGGLGAGAGACAGLSPGRGSGIAGPGTRRAAELGGAAAVDPARGALRPPAPPARYPAGRAGAGRRHGRGRNRDRGSLSVLQPHRLLWRR